MTRETMLQPTGRRAAWRGPMSLWRNDVRDLMANMFNDFGDGWFGGEEVPSLDLSETPETVDVRMDAPGLKPENIDIRVEGNLLTVTGRRDEQKEEKNRTYHRIERATGTFSRTVTLPSDVDAAKVEAQYRDGVLTVMMPKSTTAHTQKITVKG